MQPYDLSFSVNSYDYEGDLTEKNVQLHLGNGVILTFANSDALEAFSEQIKHMLPEIRENESYR